MGHVGLPAGGVVESAGDVKGDSRGGNCQRFDGVLFHPRWLTQWIFEILIHCYLIQFHTWIISIFYSWILNFRWNFQIVSGVWSTSIEHKGGRQAKAIIPQLSTTWHERQPLPLTNPAGAITHTSTDQKQIQGLVAAEIRSRFKYWSSPKGPIYVCTVLSLMWVRGPHQ